MITLSADKLRVEVHPDRSALGAAAALRAAHLLRAALARHHQARLIVASAPSQTELIAHLAAAPDLDWSRITVFHMDEYVGLPAAHPASFRSWQAHHLLAKVKPAAFHGISGDHPNPDAACAHYADLLRAAPIDLICLGIGENGHIAFNDPPVADFHDPLTIKRVALDLACRQQQVHDGCFPDLASVPREALTLTCPTLFSGAALVCAVPGPRKAAAVRATLRGPLATTCPASLLRQHPSATLYLDRDSAADLHLSELS